jgi:hypothetical protein
LELAKHAHKVMYGPNAKTERCGRPATLEVPMSVARPHSLR